MISDISQDLIEEILSRFQPHLGNDYDQLANYGTIYSKTEYSGRSTFVKLQRSLGLSCYTTIGFVHWTSISTLLLRLQSLRALFLKDSQQVDIDEIFHCDGLLLCSIKDDTRLIIWNPCLGETRWIETTPTDNENFYYGSFALGSQNNNKSLSLHHV